MNCIMLSTIPSNRRTLYGLVTSDFFPLVVTYVIGDVCSVLYIAVFYRYTRERAYAQRVLALASVVLGAITLYAVLGSTGVLQQPRDVIVQVVGYVTVCGSVVLYTSPFETIARVLLTKSSASIPVLMCTCGFVCNALWVAYGLAQRDAFVWGLGVFCALFALVQVVLYFVYSPSTGSSSCDDECVDKLHTLSGTATSGGTATAFELSINVVSTSPCFQALESPAVTVATTTS